MFGAISYPPIPIWDIGPIAFSLHGLFAALGFLAGALLASRELRKRGYDVVKYQSALTWGLVGALLGARYLTAPAAIMTAIDEGTSILATLNPISGNFSILGGFLGGISTMWGPPMVMYFIMIRLPKEAFIRAVGLVWFAGSLPLVLGYIDNGILTARTAQMSALAALPAFAGLWLGQWLRGRIPQETFRKVVLLALFVIGLNLIRRALF